MISLMGGVSLCGPLDPQGSRFVGIPGDGQGRDGSALPRGGGEAVHHERVERALGRLHAGAERPDGILREHGNRPLRQRRPPIVLRVHQMYRGTAHASP